MIYRSRYLNRLKVSPLGYRQGAHLPRQREPHRDIVPAAAQRPLSERAPYLSNRELRSIVGRCKQAITSGHAQIEDYEAFVICQQELSSRT